ncbi:hypothetical protein AA23498_0953 [Acetobacter nitrogenifigens DSM 23921 = NBRC 105050]|uniref:Uncharacterized protein n=2 Tax=Acetobacter nitrogenifigens TaxID=285268 RepID=A0A511XBK9_9PROT|nr:hypothetical protein AA23498_0953 [Acetobacter nitrogenifigens DSM 23921 = NBRC 105050]GEN60275.1 hypothetical protein ANI02nite_21590 [Acetobacter nitrogenifigens DSM 23921 = NBRC 105050]
MRLQRIWGMRTPFLALAKESSGLIANSARERKRLDRVRRFGSVAETPDAAGGRFEEIFS